MIDFLEGRERRGVMKSQQTIVGRCRGRGEAYEQERSNPTLQHYSREMDGTREEKQNGLSRGTKA